jgi:uncharacterized repeat protein (TIGR03803 family)
VSKFKWGMRACGILLLWAATAVALPTQIATVAPAVTFTVLHSFSYLDYGSAELVQGTDGIFYGAGGDAYRGMIFSITAGGTFTTLVDSSGGSALVQATNGDFYGTTLYDVENILLGAVFKVTPSGKLTTIAPQMEGVGGSPLALGTNGTFYGTAGEGGSSSQCGFYGCGTVFSVTPRGTVTVLHSFDWTDGAEPRGALVRGTDGTFYGTTYAGGTAAACQFPSSCGTIFSITAGGTFTTIYNFCSQSYCSDGAGPDAGLVQGADGNFYGTTGGGGAYGDGTVFSITAGGALTTLYNFCSESGCADGDQPSAGLVQGTDGNFYGTTYAGGTGACYGYPCGTIFSITPSGVLTTLHSFDYYTDGGYPAAGLVQGTDGGFYGTTTQGGADDEGNGTIFSLSVGLGPFVETEPASRRVGRAVKILGNNLTGATSVTFNGTPATFTVVSGTEITTTVPTGATTGTVQVVTPGGTLSSDVPFRVT